NFLGRSRRKFFVQLFDDVFHFATFFYAAKFDTKSLLPHFFAVEDYIKKNGGLQFFILFPI
ncbi:MAG: hypothetical protein IJ894_05195, partial [Bacteroidales bacterium]|nr:hypothetical protein [Bacteroidales bacterium]